MKSEDEIVARLEYEESLLSSSGGHLASIARGWSDALTWVLGLEDEP